MLNFFGGIKHPLYWGAIILDRTIVVTQPGRLEHPDKWNFCLFDGAQ